MKTVNAALDIVPRDAGGRVQLTVTFPIWLETGVNESVGEAVKAILYNNMGVVASDIAEERKEARGQ